MGGPSIPPPIALSYTYDILRDRAEVQRFTDIVVPDLDEDEALVLLLMARRKYLSVEEQDALSLGNSVVLRRDTLSRKDQLLPRVRELVAERGAFTDRDGRPLPEHAFGVYLTLNPRSHRKAAVATIKDLADRLYEGGRIRVDEVAASHLHKAVSRKPYLDFDIDLGDGDSLDATLADIAASLGSTPHHVIETRGGAHVVVPTQRLDPAVKKSFYGDVTSLGARMNGEIEVQNDAMVPVPGTCHGGTMPRLRPGP